MSLIISNIHVSELVAPLPCLVAEIPVLGVSSLVMSPCGLSLVADSNRQEVGVS